MPWQTLKHAPRSPSACVCRTQAPTLVNRDSYPNGGTSVLGDEKGGEGGGGSLGSSGYASFLAPGGSDGDSSGGDACSRSSDSWEWLRSAQWVGLPELRDGL